MYNKLDIYLKENSKNHSNSPWKIDGFYLFFGEMFIDCKSYKVNNVQIEFFTAEKKMKIEFKKEDLILGCAVVARIVCSSWGHDPDLDLYIKKKKINLSRDLRKEENIVNAFEFILSECVENGFIETLIIFKSENTFYYQNNSAFFIIDKDHDDEYYFNAEIERRMKGQQND